MTPDGLFDTPTNRNEKRSLREVMRPAPSLSPDDSLGRALMLMRHLATDRLPVLRGGRLVGEIHESDIAGKVGSKGDEDVDLTLQHPVSELVRASALVLRPQMSRAEARSCCVSIETTLLRCVPVADADDYCLGMIHIQDLLTDSSPQPRPHSIGGMATPFGVYLTDGTNQAGAGNLALVASGAALGCTFLLASLIVQSATALVQPVFHIPNIASVDLETYIAAHNLRAALWTVGADVIALLVFLVTMRSTMLAGYHAAEHQTVHAIERCEPLVPEIVARMPRAHPRCGTNLMAAVTEFLLLQNLFRLSPDLDTQTATIFAGLITMFTWRSLGTLLQERFTTRSASRRQIQSGIAAGTELMTKYRNSPPSRPRLWRRIWCMGMLQSMAGMAGAVGIGLWLYDVWSKHH
jgi:CBS domain-containing protein